MAKNTVLFIDPRKIDHIVPILNEYYKLIGSSWNYVFYCGKGTVDYWKNAPFTEALQTILELRELDVENFNSSDEYNDFMKRKELWESLKGDFILTTQVDTWPVNREPYTLDFFTALDKSYIGGNMYMPFYESIREGINFPFNNFNGGLSLRKRLDMIRIIETFPPQKTCYILEKDNPAKAFETDAEDVYFTIGCYRLGLPLGDDEASSHFAVHSFYKEAYFGIHNPHAEAAFSLNIHWQKLKNINPYLKLDNAYPKLFEDEEED